MKSIQDCHILSNGVKIPCVGYGTWLIEKEEAEDKVLMALNQGFRHIDTAACYKNEDGVGKAVLNSGIPREEIFVTSKLWNTDQGYANCKKAFASTMEKLQLEYLDLYLIHWPIAKDYKEKWQQTIQETWRAFEELYAEGKIRAIGVSNFKKHHFDVLLQTAKVMPMVNQIELHPGANQDDTVRYCKKNNVLVEAWSPLARGAVFHSATLAKLAQKYDKSIAQIVLRWELQKEVLPLPKSVTEERIRENIDLFDFEIANEDMKIIDTIKDCEGIQLDPDTIEF